MYITSLKWSLNTGYPFAKQALVFMCLQYKSLENTAGKGEIARNKQFLLFPQCFLLVWRALFSKNLKLSSANSFNLEASKICRLGKGYAVFQKSFFQKPSFNSLPHNYGF